MEICEREHLNQVDLLNQSANKISEREYRKKLAEQKKLDELNLRIINDDFTPAQTEFFTEKDRIRKAVNRIIHRAKSEEEFKKMLESEGIEITESRDRWGYKTSALKKPIRARQFGTIYEKEYILGKLGSIGDIKDYRGYYGRLKQEIKVQNAINAAQTMNYLVKNKIIGSKAFIEALSSVESEYKIVQDKRAAISDDLKVTNRMIHNVGCYNANRKYHQAWAQAAQSKKGYCAAQYKEELKQYELAFNALKKDMTEFGMTSVPELNKLKLKKAKLLEKLEETEPEFAEIKQAYDELMVIKRNYEKMLGSELSPEKKRADPGRKTETQNDISL